MHLLIVEDDDAIAAPLARGLEREGFTASRVATGTAALDAEGYDLVLLDLGMPDMDGFAICRELRSRSTVPIIVVTARGDESDRVVGLELGADDYLVKPFGFRELVARIRAVTRRAGARPVDDIEPRGSATLVVDVRTHRVTLAGAPLVLTPKEFDLLALLAEEPGVVFTRDDDPRAGLGPALVRADQDARRPRGVGAQEARRSTLDRDGARRRVPARGPGGLSRRPCGDGCSSATSR